MKLLFQDVKSLKTTGLLLDHRGLFCPGRQHRRQREATVVNISGTEGGTKLWRSVDCLKQDEQFSQRTEQLVFFLT